MAIPGEYKNALNTEHIRSVYLYAFTLQIYCIIWTCRMSLIGEGMTIYYENSNGNKNNSQSRATLLKFKSQSGVDDISKEAVVYMMNDIDDGQWFKNPVSRQYRSWPI